ncbi:hypothetical protein E4T56_gene18004 [Termitomyces sp. T112]|nr:hypothetical protein E4T56_gene18004 [Termitomyces sp. T112]
MSTDKGSKSASKKDKKSQRKSIGDTSLPSPMIESGTPMKAKPDSVHTKKQQKEKSKGKVMKEAGKTEQPSLKPTPTSSAVSAPRLASDAKKTKGKATKEVEQLEDSDPPVASAPPAPAEKQKMKRTKIEVSENVDGPTKPTTKSTLPPVPKSISATSKASAAPKLSKASDKTSQKSKKVKQKEPSLSPSSSDTAEAVDDDSEQDGNEKDLHLHGFSTDDDDSSDEDEDMDYEAPALDISKLPTIAKDDATVKRKLEKAKRQPGEDRGVVYIGRVPHGFYEDQMRGYFSQFGNVTRVRLSRNKKTGRSKHYGFIEFDSSSVAQIVAETMDNYLLTGHILRCKIIPKDEVHPELWIGANRKWRVVPRDRLTRVQHNKTRTEEQQARTAKRLVKRQNERKRKLAAAGINYDFAAVGYVSLDASIINNKINLKSPGL